jgi:hypothetical protein
VSCRAATNCTSVGEYKDTSNRFEAMLVSAAPVRPTLTVSAPATSAVGSHIPASQVTAKLTGGSAPIGKVTFEVFGPRSTAPTSCRSGGTSVGTGRVTGNKSYHPAASFTPHKPGNYWWYVSYGGDASDTAAASKCGPGMAKTVVHR